jgi:peptide chain release factor subunit 3
LVLNNHNILIYKNIIGNILLQSGKVDQNELRKFEQEAKEKHRDTWYLAYIMDINEEERQKGKTVEVGKALFQT